MLEGLGLIMEALKDVSGYAAIVAGVYLLFELLKIVVMCIAPIFIVKEIVKGWLKPRHREFRLDEITINGTVEKQLRAFLSDRITSTSYIHSSDVNELIKAWTEYQDKKKKKASTTKV